MVMIIPQINCQPSGNFRLISIHFRQREVSMAASLGPRRLFDRRLRHVTGGQPPLCQPLAMDCRSMQSQFSVDYWSQLRLHWQQNERRRLGWMGGMSYDFDISRASEARPQSAASSKILHIKVSTETYLEYKGYNRDKEHQPAGDLLVLSPSIKATQLSTKGYVASFSRVTSVRERPRSVLHRTESTAVVAILYPADYVRFLVREQPTPLTFQTAAQVV
jgi:hypothetical protein